MEVISSVLNWFSSNILQNPAFFVGLLVLIGYALLKKPAHDVFSGFVKATVGNYGSHFKCSKLVF